MQKITLYFALLLLLFNCNSSEDKSKNDNETSIPKAEFAIVIHGGAGTILKENMTPEQELAYKKVLEEAIKVGYNILKNGGSSLDAVEKTINVMEDSPLFNAGKGAVFTNAETNELDASIMDGKTLNAGASAGTRKGQAELACRLVDRPRLHDVSGSNCRLGVLLLRYYLFICYYLIYILHRIIVNLLFSEIFPILLFPHPSCNFLTSVVKAWL